mmetsp:Transcript_17160/g.47891  ORF Transcript_17160/g.47891 Transcript_17160/m.47891 type:complete len:212 (-) Transcript_17160:322-957(-)|eukprot:CAMPEP_0117648340 /NCGR_PEP_ID=MMETSP0804-20121206/346_1 /TAXON_ID=1074897 /ORGANISM="Tetraselmis astigmatica, Strain CCMP880" /LENGTH=211 /DNA_ID=CAMNT_0005453923 /DNA_START=249 /DNA_END=884 /DNA_ORIENTATION=+
MPPGTAAESGPSGGTRAKRKARDDAKNSSKFETTAKQERHSQLPDTEAPAIPDMSLFVRWYSPTGKTKVNHLLLKPIQGVQSLEGISKDLVARAFPESNRPDYITSQEFYKFTPIDQFMSLPGDIARTEFRLVAKHDGYEYTVLERELGAHRDPERKMLVTVIEFESTALMIGQLGVRVSLIAYPVVSIRKSFLDGIEEQLRTNPDFQGIS